MDQLFNLITSSEEWLMQRILDYAIEHEYAQYSSTLREPWRLSICGLSEPMLAAIKRGRTNLELHPDEDYSLDPIASFGILEAQRHRERGINLSMFLGMFKYYRQCYIDLLDTVEIEPQPKATYTTFLHRFFDRVEIGFCSEWSRISQSARFKELQNSNRKMTNEKNKYLTLFESLANPVILLDQNSCIENINHSAASLLHITSNRYYNIDTTPPQTDGTTDSPISQPVSRVMPWVVAELDTFTRQGSAYLESEKSVDTADGIKHFQVKFSAMMDVSGKYNSILIILNDQTEQKLAEERAQLARDAAEAANRAKSEFLANMSHELRTPLNAILGFTQLMAAGPRISPDQQESLGIVSRSGQHLLNLINQVLDFSKIESGRMGLNLRPVDLFALLDDLYNTFSLPAQKKQLELAFERAPNVPQHVLIDDIKLRQVLINLLNNSIKFTRTGSVTLTVNCASAVAPTNGNSATPTTLSFKVEDTGVGIAEEELNSIFDVFVQTQAGRESLEGTGLGMAISQKFVRLMGGDISITSQLGRGTRVSFEITAQRSTSTAQNLPHTNGRKITGLGPNQPIYRILVADDMLDNRLLLEKLLIPIGFEVIQATNGKEAVQIWKTWHPHLTLMDIRMPVMNGYIATRQIKQLAGNQGTKVIALSASVFDENKAATLNVGCDDFLRKPFDAEDLFLMLEKHLGVRYNYADKPVKTPLSSDEHTISIEEQQSIADCLGRQPTAWRTEFEDSVEKIDMESTYALIDQLSDNNAETATTLASLVKNFRFDILQELIR